VKAEVKADTPATSEAMAPTLPSRPTRNAVCAVSALPAVWKDDREPRAAETGPFGPCHEDRRDSKR
jgi:hypothetical protein